MLFQAEPSTSALDVPLRDEDAYSAGTATPQPSTPTPAPPRTPPPMRSRLIDLPEDDDDVVHDHAALVRLESARSRSGSLATFDVDLHSDLDRLALHTPPARKQSFEFNTGLLLAPSSPTKQRKSRSSKAPKTTHSGRVLDFTGTMAESSSMTTGEALKEFSTAELYDKNQQHLAESVPDVVQMTDIQPMATLRAEYEKGSVSFVSQIDWLVNQGFTGIRRARGDGDCFYRSLLFAYLDNLLNSSPEDLALHVGSSLSVVEANKQAMERAGVQEYVYQDAYDLAVALIESVSTPKNGVKLDPARLLAIFQDKDSIPGREEDGPPGGYLVFFLRLITSAHLKNNIDEYRFFIDSVAEEPDGDAAMRRFCETNVDPLGVEADHVQMHALCSALKINLHVAYLDGHKKDSVDIHKFESANEGFWQNPITLLYRPGHYDILVRQQA